MTTIQRDLARHALGLPNAQKQTYRNHFCIPEGADEYPNWEDLVKQGLAVKAGGGVNWSGDFFYLTLEGATQALLPGESISVETRVGMRRQGGQSR